MPETVTLNINIRLLRIYRCELYETKVSDNRT